MAREEEEAVARLNGVLELIDGLEHGRATPIEDAARLPAAHAVQRGVHRFRVRARACQRHAIDGGVVCVDADAEGTSGGAVGRGKGHKPLDAFWFPGERDPRILHTGFRLAVRDLRVFEYLLYASRPWPGLAIG